MRKEDFEMIKLRFIDYIQKRNWSDSTIVSSVNIIERLHRFLIERQGRFDIKEISRDIIDEYYNHLLEYRKGNRQKLKRATILSYMENLKRFFRFLILEQYILFNPTDHLHFRNIRKRLPKNILTIRQMKRLLNKPDINLKNEFRDRAILELLYSTGIRREEVSKIDIYDIDLESGFLRVKGKGKKERIVPVGKIACRYVKEYLHNIRPLFVKDNIEQGLFINHFGKRIVTNGIGRIVKKYMKRAGLKGFTTHSIRHSFSTHLLQGGCNIKYIQEMLGHANITTTQIYTQVVKTDLIKVHSESHPEGKKDEKIEFKFNKKYQRKGFYFHTK